MSVNIKVSLIVPVYKVESEIARCVQSILHQTLSDIEVILVDDCSPDKAIEVAMSICNGDPRFKVVRNTQNVGLGLARNAGLEIAQGHYIGFIDADDYVATTMFEKLYQKAVSLDMDIVGCDFEYRYVDGSRKVNRADISQLESRGTEYLLESLLYSDNEGFIPNSMWNKIYRRDFLIDNSLIFNSEREVFLEDLVFNFFAFQCNPKVGWINEPLYYYIIRKESTFFSYKSNLVGRYLRMYSILNDKVLSDNINRVRYKYLIDKSLFCYTFVFLSNAFRARSLIPMIKELSHICRSKTIVSNAKKFSYKEIPRSRHFSISKLMKVLFCFILKMS